MEKDKEDLRTELIIKGLEHERLVETHRSWMMVAASLPVIPQDGKVIGGSGFDLKVGAYYDFLERLMPYVPVNRPEEQKPVTAEEEADDRDKLVKEYKEMVASGQI